MKARNGDERLELTLERIEAKLDRPGERLDARIDGAEARFDHKLDLVRTELRARIELLRLEVHDDLQIALKMELGGRQVLAHAEIDSLREISRRVEAVGKR